MEGEGGQEETLHEIHIIWNKTPASYSKQQTNNVLLDITRKLLCVVAVQSIERKHVYKRCTEFVCKQNEQSKTQGTKAKEIPERAAEMIK